MGLNWTHIIQNKPLYTRPTKSKSIPGGKTKHLLNSETHLSMFKISICLTEDDKLSVLCKKSPSPYRKRNTEADTTDLPGSILCVHMLLCLEARVKDEPISKKESEKRARTSPTSATAVYHSKLSSHLARLKASSISPALFPTEMICKWATSKEGLKNWKRKNRQTQMLLNTDKFYLGVGVQLLNQQFPVLEVVVHAEVARLIDVAYQPCAVIHLTNPVGFWDTTQQQNIKTLNPSIEKTKTSKILKTSDRQITTWCPVRIFRGLQVPVPVPPIV